MSTCRSQRSTGAGPSPQHTKRWASISPLVSIRAPEVSSAKCYMQPRLHLGQSHIGSDVFTPYPVCSFTPTRTQQKTDLSSPGHHKGPACPSHTNSCSLLVCFQTRATVSMHGIIERNYALCALATTTAQRPSTKPAPLTAACHARGCPSIRHEPVTVPTPQQQLLLPPLLLQLHI